MKIIFTSIVFVMCVVPCFATNYYFSALSGDDSRAKTTAALPWKSIEKLNAIYSQLRPGDSILFKRSDTFFGTINVAASGSPENPIVLSDYGRGTKPVITSLKKNH